MQKNILSSEYSLNYVLFLGASLVYLKTRGHPTSFYERVFTVGEGLLTATALALPIIQETRNNSKPPPSKMKRIVKRIACFLISFTFARCVISRFSSSRISLATRTSLKYVPLSAMAIKLLCELCKGPGNQFTPPPFTKPNDTAGNHNSEVIRPNPFSPLSIQIPNDVSQTGSLLSPEERKTLKKTREPLTTRLSQWFKLDEMGYITALKDGVNEEKARYVVHNRYQVSLDTALFEVSSNGDAAYAEEIRTTLAGMNITSSPVSKTTGEYIQNNRPYSYVPLTVDKTGTVITPPPQYTGKKKKSSPAYLSLWHHAIWQGYKEYKNSKGSSLEHTAAQKADYERRCNKIKALHQRGLLIGRVANTQEAKDFMGHRYNMGNDILSTTLWPKEHSPLQIQLFTEYGTDTVGLLLDPTKVGTMDFGVGFKQNAGTVGSGFIAHKERIGQDGVSSLEGQRALMEAQQTALEEGGSIHSLEVSINKEDPSKYIIKKSDTRSPSAAPKKGKVYWNEQTYYRGIEKDFFTGFFVKSDSDSFSQELKTLFQLQDRIRRVKGLYVPIFQFKGKTNELEELVPDPLLLSITGLGNNAVIPMQGRQSRLSQALAAAGITTEMALQMTQALPKEGNILSLLELQLLMFNMKDITGQMTIKVEKNEYSTQYFSFEPVRLLDNLHLVFPTIHKTQNESAKQPELFFSKEEVELILQNPSLASYLQATLRHNLTRFLGITVSEDGTVTFDPKNANLFDTSDPKRSDFAKVLSRAMQCATLFKIFGDKTEAVVTQIVAEIRKTWPHLGIAPSGHDHILESKEIEAIRKETAIEKQEEVKHPSLVPPCPTSLEAIDPFSEKTPLPEVKEIQDFLKQLGIEENGTLNQQTVDTLKTSDPYLESYEKELIQAVQLLHVLKKGELAQNIMTNLRKVFHSMGYDVLGNDRTTPKGDLLIQWLDAHQNGQTPPTEFPFQEKEALQPAAPAATGGFRGRRGMQVMEEEEVLSVRGRFSQRQPLQPQEPETKRGLKTTSTKLTPDALRTQMQQRKIIPEWSEKQKQVAQPLGLSNAQGILWDQVPAFHEEDTGKPKAPYISPEDVLGAFASNLMTGPAFDLQQLKEDRESFHLTTTEGDHPDLERWITHTLAVTTEGDRQVIRANGLHYSHSARVPTGGNIDYNGGNEKHRFRSNDKRTYLKPNYPGMGGYSTKDLETVETHDALLLKDEERRMKRASILPSAYVTVTARGGYGSPRTPLKQKRRVLYLETAGAQFEKYGMGPFTYQNGTTDSNELEASDFIIKKGAQENQNPLFPSYYQGGKIPAYQAIPANNCAPLDQNDFSKPYALLKDGSLFHRAAFRNACTQYMALISSAITAQLKQKPIYLKATFFGGGFFAQAGKAGNLRSEVLHATLNAYIEAIEKNTFPEGSAIEFPRYGESSSIPDGLYQKLLEKAKTAKIHIIWTPEGDVCDYEPQRSVEGVEIDLSTHENNGTLVVLGAADVMSWSGNESQSASVEAAFGNNSNLRLVMNWWANPHILEQMARMSPGLAINRQNH